MTNPRNTMGTWTVRRRIVHATLIFCAGEVVYLTGWGGNTRLNETIVMCAFALAGAVIGCYVFGAVWDDKNMAAVAGRKRSGGADYEESSYSYGG